ncbi:MAG: histidine kinase [Gallionellales bacterium RBG_16_57_15]|nr:MAG: histidine kinase [Gallionellales bacterium RBG_16_57_15]
MAHEKITKLSWIYDLYRLGQSGGLGGQAATVQHQILEHIVQGFEGKSGTLALTNEDGASLTIAAGIDIPAQAIGSRIEFGQGILGWVAEHGRDILLNGNLGDDPRFSNLVRDKAPRPMSAMCWVLKSEQGLIGVLSVNGKEGLPHYSDDDLSQGAVLIGLISIVIENARLHLDQQQRIAALSRMNEEIRLSNQQVEQAQNQLMQSDKLALIGQLAAGVAHEINNPIGFVYSNLGSLEQYLKDIFELFDAYESAEAAMPESARAGVQGVKQQKDLKFLREDVPMLMKESRDGITRVKKIVQDLKEFSHVDSSDEWQWANLHRGIDSTLNIVWNEIKYNAVVNKEYGAIPEVECLPSQLNQVFMNLLVNASHAITGKGVITIRTGQQGEEVFIRIADTGKGIPAENLKRIFDPFFTTKPVGKGTGLGLSLSYGIVQKHNGRIEVQSEVGKGTTFTLWLPVKHGKEALTA